MILPLFAALPFLKWNKKLILPQDYYKWEFEEIRFCLELIKEQKLKSLGSAFFLWSIFGIYSVKQILHFNSKSQGNDIDMVNTRVNFTQFDTT
jgi:hypothetical protein